MNNRDWNDSGAITGPLLVTMVLIFLAFAPVLDSKMWQIFKDIMVMITPVATATIAYFAFKIARKQAQTSSRQLKIARI
jgi:hypothetical protein